MIAELLVVAGQTEEVLQPQGGSRQHVGLHRDPVAVAAGHLDDRLHALSLGQQARADGRHAHNGGLAVGDVDRIHLALEQPRLGADHLRVTVLRRPQLARDGELAAAEHPLQIAP